MSVKKFVPASNTMPVRHTALAIAVAMGFGFSGQVLAQATTGTIFGQAPVAAGETVQIVGGSGFNRTVPVGQDGRYSITLPAGTYDVTLLQNGQTVQTKHDVTALVSKSIAVDFVAASASGEAKNLSSVVVTANAIPPIDVTSTTQSTVITSEQLKNLPLARTGAAIALLAPGTVQGSTALGGSSTGEPLVSFGGSSVGENAYYINGFNTSDPLANAGGITLPYGAIAQQQTLTNGYQAQYGRSTGGVISQIGSSGTNTWHFGGAVFFAPSGLQGTQGNLYYESPYYPANVGKIYQYRNQNSMWEQVYDAYIGGPLIKDKLFFFVAAEADHQNNTTVTPINDGHELNKHYSNPKYYAKVDWNITDSNILELTGIKTSHDYNASIYNFDYATRSTGTFSSLDQTYKHSFNIGIAKFTSYITDDLTLDVLYGKLKGTYYTNQPAYAGFDPTLPNIIGSQYQNPAYCPSQACVNSNTNNSEANPANKSELTNLRFDLTYKLGDHTIQAGIDNQTTQDINGGNAMTGPGYAWQYATATPNTPIVGSTPGVAPYVGPISSPYYVSQYIFVTQATVKVTQRAQYIKDDWQVTPNLLLNLGIRNDQFTNYNPDNVAYVRLTKPQWAPRLGFSWDIMGDASMKLFGFAGRYYLALPSGVAVREASGSTFTNAYYTYTGIDPVTGIPTGLTPISSCGQTCGAGVPVSLNNEYGQPLDPNTVRSENLKAEYQDTYVLGFQQQINPSWDYGVTATWTKLGRIVDDVGQTSVICNALLAQNPGLANATVNAGANCGNSLYINPSILINPGSSNLYKVQNLNGGYAYGWVSPSAFGFPNAYRNYYSLELFLEHPWDGKWTGKIDYVYSKSYGTTDGPVQANIGQGGTSISATTQWDYGQIMQYANGTQANSRKHVLKAYGTYQFLPEWSVSGVITMASGVPEDCLGYYGTDQSNPGLGYGSFYHWCGGKPAAPGSTGFTPWTHTLDLSLLYRPLWADKKLGFQLQVRNVFNEQKITQAYPFFGSTAQGGTPDPLYKTGYVYMPGGVAAVEAPRTIQLGITYDW